jgi:hypothetical protein
VFFDGGMLEQPFFHLELTTFAGTGGFMLKLIVAVLALTLAGTASAAKWRDLRVDGSSEAAFAASLAEFKDKLPSARGYAFGQALKDIWVQGVKAAEAQQREFTVADYYRTVDGLGYEQIVTLTDPTGATAKSRYVEGVRMVRAPMRGITAAPSTGGPPPGMPRGVTAAGYAQQQHHGGLGMNPSGSY